MRCALSVLFAAATSGLSGCSAEAKTSSVDGTLVLELGGQHASLRESLRAAGIVLEVPAAGGPVVDTERGDAPSPRTAADPVAPTPAHDGGAAPEPREPQQAQQAPPEPPPPALTEPTFTVVELRQNETLMLLARRHLGDGNRYREIMALNGWSDAQSRRLATGTKVKIPVARR